MRLLFELSGESLELARAEVLAVVGAEGELLSEPEVDGRALLLDTDADPLQVSERLALAWSVSAHLYSGDQEGIFQALEGITLPGESFMVRTRRLDPGPGENENSGLASRLGQVLSKRYRVDLEDPDVVIRIFIADRNHAGIVLADIDRPSFESRKPENRPFFQPVSLHPRLARALVNLSGIRRGQTLLDPFCGTGGILLEAALVGAKPIGSDLDERMITGTARNLAHFGFEASRLIECDVADIGAHVEKVDTIVTDPPYGRSSSTGKEPIEDLYHRAFDSFSKILEPGGRLAIVLPGSEHIRLGKKYFSLLGEYPVKVHRSLTRHFCVFEK